MWHSRTKNRDSTAARIAVAILFCACALPLEAAQPRLVALRFSSALPDVELEDVLYLSLGVALSNAGFSSVREDGRGKAAEGAPYILSVDYNARGTSVDLKLALLGAAPPGSPLAEVDFVLRMDLSFDDDIEAAVRRLVDQAVMETPEEADAKAPEIADLFSSELITRDELLRTDRALRLETVLSGGGIPFFGDFSAYASYGAYGAFQVGAIFIKRNWSLSTGARFSFIWPLLSDGVRGGQPYVSSAGANFQLGLGAAQSVKLAVCASGGVAVLTLTQDDESMSMALPYVDGGVQAAFPIGRDFFLGADLRFMAAFARDIALTGGAIAVSVNKEF